MAQNPYYVGSGATYGSRGLTPSSFRNGSGAVPMALANLAGMALDAATYDPTTDPRAQQARLAGAQYNDLVSQQQARGAISQNLGTVSPTELVRQGLAGGYKPEDVGHLALIARAATGPEQGVSMDQFTMDGALWEATVRPSGSTMLAGTYDDRMKPTNVMQNGAPTIVRASDSYGQQPILNKSEVEGGMLGRLAGQLTLPEQKQVVGANPPQQTPYNYVGPNGQGSTVDPASVAGHNVSLYTGQVQSPTANGLRPTVTANLQSQSLANQQFSKTLDLAESIAVQDPTLFGTAGNIRRFSQNLWQQVKNVSGLAPGLGLPEAYEQTFVDAAQKGIALRDPTTFDPNLSDIHTIAELMVFGAAEALANQQGRSVSDKDVGLFRGIVGDPTAWGSSQEQFVHKLGMVRKVLQMKQDVIGGALGSGLGATAAAGVNPNQPPTDTQSAAPEMTATNPQTGEKVKLVNGQWVPM